jgi:phage terminase large subunit-like protein
MKYDSIEQIHQYGYDVLAGEIVTCEYVKKAVKRHFDDLDHAHERGLWFDEQAALHAVNFFPFLRHSKGEWAGKPVELEPWQLFWTAIMFGWKKENGYRRFRTCYIEIARKNGKSTWASGFGNYLFYPDGEPGAEVYTVATKEDQARIVWEESKRMIQKSKTLRKRVGMTKKSLFVESLACVYRPLGKDSETQDGLNVHGAIIDELHAHKTPDMWDVIETGMGARRQPMMIAITTAGVNKQGICYEQRTYLEKILDGIVQDDSYFGVIYTLDKQDDPFSPDTWIKANPNLGISVKLDDLQRLATKASETPRAINNYLTKRLNIWCNAEERWLDMNAWIDCADNFTLDDMEGRTCFVGVDLSKKIDLTAVAFVFPPSDFDEFWRVFVKFYFPEDNIEKRTRETRVPMDVWAKQEYITTTPGNVVDYGYIEDDLVELSQKFDIQEIAYDPWNASQFAIQMQDKDFVMVEIRQGARTLNEPCKEFEAKILSRMIKHTNNPVLNWNASNVVVEPDRNGNYLPSKKKSTDSIDGVAALLNGLSRAIVHEDESSVYSNRGIFLL